MPADAPFANTITRAALRALALAWASVFALAFAALLGIVFLGNPRAADPVVQLTLPPMPRAPAPRHTARATPPPAAPAAATPVTQAVYAGKALVADPALIENTAQGPLPKIAADGRSPMQAYAAPAPPVDAAHPRIAIVVSGLGVSAKATAAAIAGLPAAVTLAFAPYAPDVQQWVNQARASGHEVLLEVPMEPFDFPDSDPGPHTLRAGTTEAANADRLTWSLTRITGYTGVTNLLGSRFLTDADGLAPVLTTLARRGLLFYDNGASARSIAPDLAARSGTAFAQATTTIDAIQAAMEIDRQLSNLEASARVHGSASGAGFLYPVTVERVAKWAEGLSGRGFVLVPASAIVAPKHEPATP